ncbi:DUF2490 domain-containing protein [Flavobacterium sp. RSB2_4_14]|uniref:DUF2490 domain-containing protein n=1 Tax=Flavobacterium sp. RSB2_4_14 TaxID=3447665 RepID=UPI003F41784C
MPLRYNIKLFSLLILFFVANNSAKAQNSSLEFWPEADLWYTLNSSWRFSAFVPVTRYNESKARDINVYLQTDYKWGHSKFKIYRRLVDENKFQEMKQWMVRGGYMKGWSLGDGEYSEDMVFSELHKRLPLKNNILISHRLRSDFRWLGEDSDYSYRLRYRVMIEKEFASGPYSIVPYVNAEPFWDSRYDAFTRLRTATGATLSTRKHFAYEANVTYQYDNYYATKNLFALNVILHIYLEKQAQ